MAGAPVCVPRVKMSVLRLIFPDQLSRNLSALQDLDPQKDLILMVETHEEATYVKHHQQKLVLFFSAMRHFAENLKAEQLPLLYVEYEDPTNTGTLMGEVKRVLKIMQFQKWVVTAPGEWRQLQLIKDIAKELNLPLEIREDSRFFCSSEQFKHWAQGRKQLRMEYFYREMRKQTGMLMQGQKPVGGKWNYDTENRKALPTKIDSPALQRFAPDPLTQSVIALVQRHFSDHFGQLDNFGWAVTRDQALIALDFFIQQALPNFGDYQDAMRSGEDFLFHSALSPYLNLGLLEPKEVCEAAIAAWDAGQAPLNAVEGFLRQILGWREFVRGIYALKMPDYAQTNFLEAQRPLPDFYWHGKTRLNCLHECISATMRNAYAHHIQRLMVTGNFALLAGVAPAEVEAWYLMVYADAFEWVELPNTHGMVLHADGGLMASKPYAASGAYIQRMSDYCKSCDYKPSQKTGPEACPFNYLYWDFLIRNRPKLQDNPRLGMPYQTLSKMSPARLQEIQSDARVFLDSLSTQKSRE